MLLPDYKDYLNVLKPHKFEDFFDRLNYSITCYLLLAFFGITGYEMHFGNPISCLTPVEAPRSWSEYFLEYCFTSVKMIPNAAWIYGASGASAHTPTFARFDYYQWVPYMLAVQVFVVWLLRTFWLQLSYSFGNGMDIDTTVAAAMDVEKKFGDERKKKIKLLAQLISLHGRDHDGTILGSWRVDCVFYALQKWLCMLSAIGQYILIAQIIARGNFLWPKEQLERIYNGMSDINGGYFPFVTVCDSTQYNPDVWRGQYMSLPRSMACVLFFNFVNEKIFIFLSLWFAALAVINISLAVSKTAFIFVPAIRMYSTRHFMPPSLPRSDPKVQLFIHGRLHADGVLLMHLVAAHVGKIVVRDLATELYEIHVVKLERSDTCESGLKNSGSVCRTPELMEKEDMGFRESMPRASAPVPSEDSMRPLFYDDHHYGWKGGMKNLLLTP